MKEPDNQSEEATPASPPLMLTDHRLKRAYSVMEIATLAAGCRGDKPEDRIEEAIQLLASVEWNASKSKSEKLREILTRNLSAKGVTVTPQLLDSRVKGSNASDIECALWEKILNTAERDEATDKIKRSSLALEICKAAKIGITTEAHAARKYGQWLQSDLDEAATRHEVVSLEEYKSAYESGRTVRLIHDDTTARVIIVSFLLWLEDGARKKIPTPVQSHKVGTKGQIVSPKNRGAERDEDGRFSVGR